MVKSINKKKESSTFRLDIIFIILESKAHDYAGKSQQYIEHSTHFFLAEWKCWKLGRELSADKQVVLPLYPVTGKLCWSQ